MTDFEHDWHDKYMANMVTLATLEKLIKAERLAPELVDMWVAERMEKYGAK